MPSEQSPTVRRRRLALELRRLREAAGLTCEEVGQQLECSASKISRIETGRVLVNPRDVRDMLAIYGVPEDEREALAQLARDSRQKGWWHAWNDSLQPSLATYLGMESAAAEIRVYQIRIVPGLLQTEGYAAELLAAGQVPGAGADPRRRAGLLAERQRQAASAAPPRLWAVLDERVLRRQVGGPDIMRAQLEHLREICALPNYFLQVAPFRPAAAYVPAGMPFAILSFPDERDPDVVYMRYSTGNLWIEDTDEVALYRKYFGWLQAAALSCQDTPAYLASLIKEL